MTRTRAKFTAAYRRDMLLTWLRRAERGEMTAEEIVDQIGHPYLPYDEVGHYRYSRCFDDLLALEREELVYRVYLSRPARWGLS